MGIYLNPRDAGFSDAVRSEIYIDKKELIKYTNKYLGTEQKYICVSRPRRFGKSMALKMLAAYYSYSYGCDSRELFRGRKIESDSDFDGLRADIVKMLGGECVKVNTFSFQNDMCNFRIKDDVLTLLIHLGYLGYDAEQKEAFIPNREIMEEFENAMSTGGWSEIMRILNASEKLLEATLREDEKSVAARLDHSCVIEKVML